MTHVIYTREGVIRRAAELAADGEDVRYLADEHPAYREEILEVARLVWDEQMDADEAIAAVLDRI